MKKVIEAEKKKAENENKIWEKAKGKNQAMNSGTLAISNSQIVVGAFKEILSDLPTGFKALNIILDLFDSTILDIPRPELINLTLKDFSISMQDLVIARKRKPLNKR